MAFVITRHLEITPEATIALLKQSGTKKPPEPIDGLEPPPHILGMGVSARRGRFSLRYHWWLRPGPPGLDGTVQSDGQGGAVLRARVGYAWHDGLLFFAVGLALGVKLAWQGDYGQSGCLLVFIAVFFALDRLGERSVCFRGTPSARYLALYLDQVLHDARRSPEQIPATGPHVRQSCSGCANVTRSLLRFRGSSCAEYLSG